jgi:hypothetical protein
MSDDFPAPDRISARQSGDLDALQAGQRAEQKSSGTSGKLPQKQKKTIFGRLRAWWIATSLGLAWIAFDQYYLPRTLSFAAHEWAQSIGIELTTGDWSVDWLNQTISAESIVLGSPGEALHAFRAERVLLDFSVLRLLDGWRKAIHQLRIERPQIDMHKPLGGEWNLSAYFDSHRFASLVSPSIPASATATTGSADDDIRFDWVIVEDGTISVREEMSGRSDGTTTERRFADIQLDDVSLRARDVVWPASAEESIQTWQVQARIGTGELRLSSAGNLLTWRQPKESEPEWGFTPVVWNPRLQGTLTLQRFAVETLSRLLPDAHLVATRGEVSGPVAFELFDRTFLRLDAPGLVFDGVEYVDAENHNSYAANPTVSARLEGNLADPAFRPAALTAATLTESGLRDQPIAVRATAVRQTRTVQGGLTEQAEAELESQRSPEVQALLSQAAAGAITQSLHDELGASGAAAAGELAGKLMAPEAESGNETQPGLLKRMGTRIGTTTRNVWKKITGKDD